MFKVKLFFFSWGLPSVQVVTLVSVQLAGGSVRSGGSGTLLGSVTCREGGMPGRAGQECVLWRVHPLLWL